VNRIARIEVGTALAGTILALVTGLYLTITTFSEHEACYGISNSRIVCHPFAPNSPEAAQAAGRIAVVLSIVLALYIGGLLGAWWQSRTSASDSRGTALGVLATCSITLAGVILAAIQGVGFFFLPSMLLMVAATVAGAWALLQQRRVPAPPVARRP
jgi:hypothetical protein